jgi:hypothetical protein
MSWQEDLQELDNALASGRISADEYRRQRDEVLASASTAAAPPEQAPQQAASPFPPPFKWGTAPPEATQVVQGGGLPRQDADRTQVVRPGAEPPKGDADRTQFVRPVTGAPPPQDGGRTHVIHGGQVPQGPQGPNSGGFPAQNAPGWSDDSAPPWGGEFPQMNMGDAWGNKQGPEVFDEGKGGGKGKIIAIVLAVVVLLGAGFGAYMLWGRGGGNNTATGGNTTTTSKTTTTTTTTPKKVPEGPFVELTGKVAQFKTLSIAEAVTAKVPAVEEAQLLQQSGVTDVRFVVGPDGTTGITQGIWAFKAAKDPAAALAAIDQLYQSAGFEQLATSPKGVLTRHLPVTATNATSIYRAHYVSTDFVVRVEAYGPDDAAAVAALDSLLKRQLEKFPAG